MKAHVIENGKVVNTIEVESLDFMPGLVAAPEGTGIGWDYINGQLVDNRPKPPEPEPAPPPTKEQLMAELAALTAKIQALE
jgi:hypothetical protein